MKTDTYYIKIHYIKYVDMSFLFLFYGLSKWRKIKNTHTSFGQQCVSPYLLHLHSDNVHKEKKRLILIGSEHLWPRPPLDELEHQLWVRSYHQSSTLLMILWLNGSKIPAARLRNLMGKPETEREEVYLLSVLRVGKLRFNILPPQTETVYRES